MINDKIIEFFKQKDVRRLTKVLFDIDLTPSQVEIVREVAFDEHKRTIINCMTRYGKSFCTSIGVCIWILRNKGKKLGIVAPTNEKTTIIRNYIAYFINQCPYLVELLDLDRMNVGASRIQKEVSKKRMTWKNGIELRTLSAEGTGDQLMGFGFDKVIVDEECLIDYEVYRAKIMRMLGESKDSTYVGIGNPLHRDNQMYEHWIDPDWHKIHIDYKIAVEEGRISEEFIEELRNTLTPKEFKILYEAEFPEDSEDQLIKTSWIKKAIRSVPSGVDNYMKIMSGDIARHGKDLTVLTYGYKHNGLYIVKDIKEAFQSDTMETVGKILKILDTFDAKKITIDTDGLGAGVTDRLKELKKQGKVKADIVPFHSGQSPTNDAAKERFLNKKAQSYFHLRELFEKGNIIIPDHKILINQLLKMKWEQTSNGKIKILDPGTAKEDTAEKKSPDFADSLNYFSWEDHSGFAFVM